MNPVHRDSCQSSVLYNLSGMVCESTTVIIFKICPSYNHSGYLVCLKSQVSLDCPLIEHGRRKDVPQVGVFNPSQTPLMCL